MISAPRPFVRTILGDDIEPGFNPDDRSIYLDDKQHFTWTTLFHSEPFKRALRSIARERSFYQGGTPVQIKSPDGVVLATCRWQFDDLWKGLNHRQQTVMQVVGRGPDAVRREQQKRYDACKTRLKAHGMGQTLQALKRKGYIDFTTEGATKGHVVGWVYTELWHDYLEQSDDKEGQRITLGQCTCKRRTHENDCPLRGA